MVSFGWGKGPLHHVHLLSMHVPRAARALCQKGRTDHWSVRPCKEDGTILREYPSNFPGLNFPLEEK